MLISNLWVEAGLVNGSMGTIQAICYPTGCPPSLSTAVMVQFDSYSGPTLPLCAFKAWVNVELTTYVATFMTYSNV